MIIDIQTQMQRDYDWFCADSSGAIGHFTTAGFKHLPSSVAASAEDLEWLTRYFKYEALGGRGYRVDLDLTLAIPDPKNRGERYLRNFVAMADKGLFSYDIKTYVEPGLAYFRVACPEKPLTVLELPYEVRKILERTVLRAPSLADCPRIAYAGTLKF